MSVPLPTQGPYARLSSERDPLDWITRLHHELVQRNEEIRRLRNTMQSQERELGRLRRIFGCVLVFAWEGKIRPARSLSETDRAEWSRAIRGEGDAS